jgi:hypothetical protein
MVIFGEGASLSTVHTERGGSFPHPSLETGVSAYVTDLI